MKTSKILLIISAFYLGGALGAFGFGIDTYQYWIITIPTIALYAIAYFKGKDEEE